MDSNKNQNLITVELWSWGAGSIDDPDVGPMPVELQRGCELHVGLRHLTSVYQAPAEIQNLDGRNEQVKRYIFRDEHARHELEFREYDIKRILANRRDRGLDQKQKQFRFSFYSQSGLHRAVAFVSILAYRLQQSLEPGRYIIRTRHFELDQIEENEEPGAEQEIVPARIESSIDIIDPSIMGDDDDPLGFGNVVIPDEPK